jgi:thioredoxin-like negative regulator of GroEL
LRVFWPCRVTLAAVVHLIAMLTPDALRASFNDGLAYDPYVATGSADQQQSWRAFRAKVTLSAAQRELIAGMTRQVNVLAISGTWCGDCVQQVPMLDAIAGANPEALRLRLVDRDEHKALSDTVKICGGNRVPTVLFLNEDFEFLGLYGDKSLARLRAQAQKALGAACMLPSANVAGDELAATLQDWVNEVERAHLIARLSPRLRQRHGD